MWTHLVYNPGKQPVHSVQRSAVCAVAGNNNVFIFASPHPRPMCPVSAGTLISSLSDPETSGAASVIWVSECQSQSHTMKPRRQQYEVTVKIVTEMWEAKQQIIPVQWFTNDKNEILYRI